MTFPAQSDQITGNIPHLSPMSIRQWAHGYATAPEATELIQTLLNAPTIIAETGHTGRFFLLVIDGY